MEDVPYITGLDKWLGNELDDEACTYLKDFGAATASNGAVGLYHVDGLTPEAKKLGQQLKYADKKGFKVALVIGLDESARDVVNLKDLRSGGQLEVSAEIESLASKIHSVLSDGLDPQ